MAYAKNHIVYLSGDDIHLIILCCEDITVQEIANKMNKKIKTVRKDIENIYRAFGVKKRVSLIMLAVKHKIVNPNIKFL